MEHRDSAIAELRNCSAACAAALAAFAEPSTSPPSSSLPALPVLHRDLISLLSLIYASITRLAISLKPSSPTWSASLTPLKELARNVLAATTCACLHDERTHGATLAKEVKGAAKEVVGAVRDLVQTFLAIATSPDTDEHQDEYLIKAGTVHDLIERARGPDGISKDNLIAVRKKWAEDKAVMDDALKEMGEMIEEAEADDDREEAEGESDEDGWDELGLSSKKMDKHELKRAKAVHPLLRLINLLHKRILLDLLAPSSTMSNYTLDILLAQSSANLAAYDDVIGTLYSPQVPASIPPAVTSLVTLIHSMGSTIIGILPNRSADDLEAQVQSLAIGRTSTPETGKAGGKMKDVRKWYETCFVQIGKMSSSIEKEIATNDK